MANKKCFLGKHVKDSVSGFAGYAMIRIDDFVGNVRYAIQPEVKEDGTVAEAMDIDEHFLVVTPKKKAHTPITPPKTDIKIGDEVTDVISGFAGVVDSKLTSLNGCIHLNVVQKGVLGKDGKPNKLYFDAPRLKKTGVVEKAVAEAPQSKTGPRMERRARVATRI